MKTNSALLMLVLAGLSVAPNLRAQVFQNLDFESADLTSLPWPGQPGSVDTGGALPGWTVVLNRTNPNGSSQVSPAQIPFNPDAWNSSWNVAIVNTGGALDASIEGAFSVLLRAAVVYLPGGTYRTDVSISQTGLVPAATKSILFKGRPGTQMLRVAVDSQNLRLVPIETRQDYTLYGVDVSVFAGSQRNVSFAVFASAYDQTGWNLDSITFSDQALPHPNPEPLKIVNDGGNAVLTWSNPEFSLQASGDVAGSYTNVPGAASPYIQAAKPGSQMFFRLISN